MNPNQAPQTILDNIMDRILEKIAVRLALLAGIAGGDCGRIDFSGSLPVAPHLLEIKGPRVRRSRWDLYELPIGEAIFVTRRAQKLSGPMLSVKSGVHRNTLIRIEEGTYAPSMESLVMIAKALEVEVSTLLHRAEKLRPAQRIVQSVAEDKIA